MSGVDVMAAAILGVGGEATLVAGDGADVLRKNGVDAAGGGGDSIHTGIADGASGGGAGMANAFALGT